MTTLAAPSDRWVGSYDPVVLTQVIKRAAEQRKTGALSVVSGPSVKTVHFFKGSVKFAASNVRRDRLGESMLAHEFISATDYELASQKMLDEGCRFGEALLSLGRMTEKELQRELAIQVQRIVLSLFRIPEGMYSFDLSDRLPACLPFGLAVPPLLLKGLRSIEDGKLILSALPSADRKLRASTPPPLNFDAKKLADAERSVLELAGDGMSVGDIIRNCEHGQNAAFRSCFALLTLGFLEPVPAHEEDSEAGALPSTETSPIVLAGENDAPEDESLAKMVDAQYERLDQVSEADLLGVRPGAPLAAIEQAYDELKNEWTEAREQTRDPELIEKIGAIELRLAAAFAQLLVVDGATESRALSALEEAPPPEDFTKRNRVEQLERDAELHLQVKDWKGAVLLLLELVALAPERARYQAMLGKAKQHQSSTRKSAEQHFLEAVRLEPENVPCRLALGRYYKAIGNRTRAQAELRHALDLDPGNEEAVRLLGALQERTRMQKLFHRVFG